MAAAASKMKQLMDAMEMASRASKSADKSWQTIADNTARIETIQKRVQQIENARALTGRYGRGERRERTELREQLRELEQVQVFLGNAQKLRNSEAFDFYPQITASLRKVVDYHSTINAALIQGNTSLSKRVVLTESIAVAQIRTGASTQDMADATKALLNYGHDLHSNFGETLRITTMMKVGLGVSAENTARLLATTRAIGGNMTAVVDGIARVKSDTALSADQAARFATELGNAMALLGPQSGRQIGAITEYINRLEGAAQGIGIQAGEMKKMLTGFTTESGMMGISTLGFDPSFMTDLGKTQKVTEGFVNYVEKQLAGTSGYQRMVTLQLLAEQFNTTTELVGRAREVMEAHNKQTKSGTTLQKEWNRQTGTITESWNRLKNSMEAIFHSALLPLIVVAGRLLGAVASVTDWIMKFKASVVTLGIAINAFIVTQVARWALALKAAGIAQAVGTTAAAAGATGAATASRIAGWAVVTKMLPMLSIGIRALGVAVFSIPTAIATTVAAGFMLWTKVHYASLDKINARNTSLFVKLSKAGGKDLRVWEKETNLFLSQHPGMKSQDVEKYLRKTVTQVTGVQEAVMRGDRLAAKKAIEGTLLRFQHVAGAKIYREALQTNVTVNRREDMARDQALLDTNERTATNTALVAQILENTAKKQLLELELQRHLRGDALEWRANQEAALRSLLTNSSSSSTLLNSDAGVKPSNY